MILLEKEGVQRSMSHPNRVKFFKEAFYDSTCIGVELGVASGDFSAKLLEACPKMFLYSIDAWNGDMGHDQRQYISASDKLSKFYPRSFIIKSFFSEACKMFPDYFFDFIYIDGYAHTGQNDGHTLDQWFPKLKKNGIFSGHDYHERWQATIDQVNIFVRKHNQKLGVIEDEPFPSWALQKHG